MNKIKIIYLMMCLAAICVIGTHSIQVSDAFLSERQQGLEVHAYRSLQQSNQTNTTSAENTTNSTNGSNSTNTTQQNETATNQSNTTNQSSANASNSSNLTNTSNSNGTNETTNATTNGSNITNATNETNGTNATNSTANETVIVINSVNQTVYNTIQIQNILLNSTIDLSKTKATCQGYRVPTNYMKTQVQYKNISGVDKIYITDQQLAYCNVSQYVQSSNSSFQISIAQSENITNNSNTIGTCAKYLYIYVVNNESTQVNISSTVWYVAQNSTEQINLTNVSYLVNKTFVQPVGTIETTYVENQPCVAHDKSENKKIQCAQVDPQFYYQSNQPKCDSKCQLFSCRLKNPLYNASQNDSQKDTSVLDLVVPIDERFSDENCYDHYLYNQSMEQYRMFAYRRCGLAFNVSSTYSIPDKFSWSLIVILVVVFLFLIFLLTVCYYRFQLSANKQAPFTPPGCCPNFIYPRYDYSQQFEMEATNNYQPPTGHNF